MTDFTELLSASRELAKYLRTSVEHDPKPLQRFQPSTGDRLRLEAEAADANDAAILRFRAALAAIPETE